MNSPIKMAFAAAVLVVAGAACSPAAVTQSAAVSLSPVGSPSAPVAASPVASPSATVAASPAPSLGQQPAQLQVAGTDVIGPSLRLTVDLPAGWEALQFGADRGTSSPPAGMAFIVSLVDNTFADPCSHSQRSPKVGPTVDDLAKALDEIPGTTATRPVKTTIAGYAATYVEIAIPAALPCDPDQFYIWQDSPNGNWWVQGLGETARVWILEVGGRRVAFLAHAYPASSADAKADFEKILNSAVFVSGT